MKQKRIAILGTALLGAGAISAVAAPITPGDLLIYRVGDGTGNLVNTGNAVFLDEYTTSGTLVQSIEMPTATSGTTNALIASGTATSEGLLTISPNGQYLALTGYDVSPGGSTSVAGTAGTTVPRTIGIVNVASGSVDTTTALSNYASGNNPRSAVTTDGANIWADGAAGGVIYTTDGSTGTSDTTVSTTVANLRQINIFGSQLYVSTSSGSAIRIGAVGSGVPNTTGQTTTSLPGLPTSGTASTPIDSPYSFFLTTLNPSDTSPDTLYIADDTVVPAGGTTAGEIIKYSLVSGSWSLTGTIAAPAIRGLTGTVLGTTVDLYGTTGGSTASGGGSLYGAVDSSGYDGVASGSATVLASAATDEAFRGIAYVPAVPEPVGMGMIALAGIALGRRWRKRPE